MIILSSAISLLDAMYSLLFIFIMIFSIGPLVSTIKSLKHISKLKKDIKLLKPGN